METNITPKPERSSGAVAGSIIIIIILLLGAFYFWKEKRGAPPAPATSEQQPQSGSASKMEAAGSDALPDLSADLQATDMSTLDSDIASVDQALQ